MGIRDLRIIQSTKRRRYRHRIGPVTKEEADICTGKIVRPKTVPKPFERPKYFSSVSAASKSNKDDKDKGEDSVKVRVHPPANKTGKDKEDAIKKFEPPPLV